MDIDLIKLVSFTDAGGQYIRFFKIGNNIWFDVTEISKLLKCDIEKDYPDIKLGRVFINRIIHTGELLNKGYEEKNSAMTLIVAIDVLMLLDKIKSEISDDLRSYIFATLPVFKK